MESYYRDDPSNPLRFFPSQEKDEPRYHGEGEITERDTGVLLKRTTFILTLQVLIH